MTLSKYNVSQEKQDALNLEMRQLGINESEIIEQFIRSSGHGGQKINKTSSCVYLKHLPSKIEVKCQKTRSQALNRFFARRILVKKISAIIFHKKSAEQKLIAKIRKQKQKRSKRAKEKMLKIKKEHSQKKQLRTLKPEIDTE